MFSVSLKLIGKINHQSRCYQWHWIIFILFFFEYLSAKLKNIAVHLKYQLSISVVSQIPFKWNTFLIHSVLDHTIHTVLSNTGCFKFIFYFSLLYAQMVICLLWGELLKWSIWSLECFDLLQYFHQVLTILQNIYC